MKDSFETADKLLLVQSETLLLKPVHFGEQTMVYEKKKKPVLIPHKTLKIIKKSCLKHAATYEGRKKASMFILGTKTKLPLVIDSVEGTYLFPLASHLKPDCVWVAFSHVAALQEIDKKQTNIFFKDGQEALVKASLFVVWSQMNLTNEFLKRTETMDMDKPVEKVKRQKWITGKNKMMISFSEKRKKEKTPEC